MIRNWDFYTRKGLDIASATTELGFAAVKTGTRLGFSITRGIASATAAVTGAVVDHTIFGGSAIASPVLDGAVTSVFILAEQVALAPIFLGEYITSTSLLAAHSSINLLSTIFPGSSEASFSLASFITLVKREWNDPADSQSSPPNQFGITQVARATVAWVALQGVTQEWQEKQWFKSLREINVNAPTKNVDSVRKRRDSRVRVTSDIIFPGNRGQIIVADIGEAPVRAQSTIHGTPPTHKKSSSRSSIKRFPALASSDLNLNRHTNAELKATLRRLSKMVLAGYGGASLLFFGVSPTAAHAPTKPSGGFSARAEKAEEESHLAHAIDASEAEAAGNAPEVDNTPDLGDPQYSWWDVLLGRHDHEIFERVANSQDKSAEAEIKAKMRATAVVGVEHLMPRFWVLTDHDRRQIVLVLRGTMSLNEIAVDLTCDREEFEPAFTPEDDGEVAFPGKYSSPSAVPFPTSSASSTTRPRYYAHGGMLRMARAMGDIGKPVHLAVQTALHRNPDYELLLCGHSLGAGVAGILALMWADPETCLTVPSSGLPVGRQVSVYCFAPPCLTDAALSRLSRRLIVSFVYSHDVVSRLSLGSIRDLKNAAMWLCEANEATGGRADGEGYAGVTARAGVWKSGGGSPDDPQWFIAVRKTLEANMQMADLFPPGRVLWAMRDGDLHRSHRLRPAHPDKPGAASSNDKLRLFEVLDVEKVFSQIVFAKDMLSAHLPHQYDKVLHDLL
ncbi:hypothetical protein HGRIS_009185 [Hohenbuehelia grisea]|uniref:sn-1-specific diacylglycerol lipase n=1 Tax=Hohenbuehelia grisea TaxID=104357 RepID=A0ABR3J0U7_9AGAR